MVNMDIVNQITKEHEVLRVDFLNTIKNCKRHELRAAKTIYANEKRKLLLKYEEYEEELNYFFNSSDECFKDFFRSIRTPCPQKRQLSCRDCCTKGHLYKYLLTYINTKSK